MTTPYPLNTQCPFRILTWPDWSSSEDLSHLLQEYAGVLLTRDDACLIMRHDATADAPLTEGLDLFNACYQRAFPGGQDLNILILDEELSDEAMEQLKPAVSCAVRLPSMDREDRAAFFGQISTHVFDSGKALSGALQKASS